MVDALKMMPPEFRNRFEPHKDLFMQGSTDPDTLLKDFQNHYYHAHGSRKHQQAAEHLRQSFHDLIALFKQGSPDEELAHALGILSHYVADLNQPLHTAGAETDPEEDTYHSRFEKEVESQLSKIPAAEFSYEPVSDPVEVLLFMVNQASTHYREIGEVYHSGRNIFDLLPMVHRQYQEAVRHTVNYWLGIARGAGMKITIASGPDQIAFSVTPETGAASPLPQKMGGPVNINSASLEQLVELPGIGKKRAQDIIRARPYKSIYDLTRVKGLSIKLVERISNLIAAE